MVIMIFQVVKLTMGVLVVVIVMTHNTNPPARFIMLMSTFWFCDSLLWTWRAGTRRWRTGWS